LPTIQYIISKLAGNRTKFVPNGLREVSIFKNLYLWRLFIQTFSKMFRLLIVVMLFMYVKGTELNNAERSAVRNAGDRARTRLGDWAGLAGYLKWPVFVGFSRTVNNPVG